MLGNETVESWSRFLEFVKERCSETAYDNWFKPIRIVEAKPDVIVLEVPNIFVKEYLLTNYSKDLSAFLPTRTDGTASLEFVIAPSKEREGHSKNSYRGFRIKR